MSLKDNLVRIMKEKSKRIRELADETDISMATLKRLRTKDCNPTLDILIKLSQALDININELIEDGTTLKTFLQNQSIAISKNETEFIYIFTENTFSFKNGTRAIFKVYDKNHIPITKYILHKNGKVMETIETDNLLFKDSQQNLYKINTTDIFGVIIKQLYEVNYV